MVSFLFVKIVATDSVVIDLGQTAVLAFS